MRQVWIPMLSWVAVSLGCGEVTVSTDAAPFPEPDAASDALSPVPDAGSTPDGSSILCGLITFEDALAVVNADNPQVSAPSPLTLADVTFKSGGGEPVFNMSATISGQPFTSDYFGIYTYDEGSRIDFAAPMEYVRFEHGQMSVETGATFELWANDTLQATFTASHLKLGVVEVTLSPPATGVQILWAGSGSTGLLNLDNFEYRTPGCL